MKPVAWVGNDVVDLADPRTHERASDERFLRRVCDPREVDVIRASDDPDLELWCHWAAKETGFKIVSKLLGEPPPFAHRRFRVVWSASTASRAEGEVDRGRLRVGRVVYERDDPVAVPGSSAPVRLEAPVRVNLLSDRALHALGRVPTDGEVTGLEGMTASAGSPATDGLSAVVGEAALLHDPHAAWSGTLAQLLGRFSAREADAVYSLSSAAVRLAARSALALRLGVDESRLEIVCAPGPTSQRIPSVLVDGEQAGADVSLSHDGRWIAWAIAAPPTAQETSRAD